MLYIIHRQKIYGAGNRCYSNPYGKGRSIYFAGTIGQALIEWHFWEYFDILAKIIQDRSPQLVYLDAPESVILNVRKNSATGDILVYLTNLTGCMTRPIRKVCKHYGLKITTSLNLESARSVCSGKELPLEICDNKSILTIPELDEFEVIALKEK